MSKENHKVMAVADKADWGILQRKGCQRIRLAALDFLNLMVSGGSKGKRLGRD